MIRALQIMLRNSVLFGHYIILHEQVLELVEADRVRLPLRLHLVDNFLF